MSFVSGLSYSIDAERGIARVSGKIDPGQLLLMLKKAAKHAKLLWVDSGNHCGYYTDNQYMNAYGSMEPYIRDPYQSGYFHSEYYDYPPYDPSYSYFEQLARHFPQAPPPPQNPRLESFCNMM